MSAIVLDGHLKSALACVRSLGRHGVAISCGADRTTAMSLYSKYTTERFVYVSPKISQDDFVRDLVVEAKKHIARNGEKPVVFCFSDATVATLARRYTELQEYVVIPLPSYESFVIAFDKQSTYTLAETLTIPTIKTFSEEHFNDVDYPAVVKNRHSIVWKKVKSVSGSATFVFSKQELDAMYAKIKNETGEAPLVQTFVKGAEYGVEMVCDKGESVSTFVHKRIRSLSPRGGAAVVKETAKETEEVTLMRAYAHALVKNLEWRGPVMVEFKIDDESGRVLLMEINGRFWGSLPLAVKAGVDFPMMVYQLAMEESVVQKPEAFVPPYVRTRHFLGDCKWLLAVLFKHDKLRAVLYPSRLRALYDFKKEIFISQGDVFVLNDLKPSIMEYADLVYKALCSMIGPTDVSAVRGERRK